MKRLFCKRLAFAFASNLRLFYMQVTCKYVFNFSKFTSLLVFGI